MICKLILFSDTHETATLEHWHALTDKRMLGLVNSNFIRKSRYNRNLIAPAIERMLAEKPDAILFTGDATSCGQPGEFARALRLFKPILKSSIPFIYTPGNHDAYVRDRACSDALRRFCLRMNRGLHALQDYPFITELPALRIVALNCARPTNPASSCGYMTEHTRAFLMHETAAPKQKPLVCAGHFQLLERHPVRSARRRLYGGASAAGMLGDGRIDLSLCGHVHKPCEILDSTGRGEITAGSLTKYGLYSRILYDSQSNIFTLERVPVTEF